MLLDLADWGIHPHGDRKSAEAFETKADVKSPLSKRVRKEKEVKELKEIEDAKGTKVSEE